MKMFQSMLMIAASLEIFNSIVTQVSSVYISKKNLHHLLLWASPLIGSKMVALVWWHIQDAVCATPGLKQRPHSLITLHQVPCFYVTVYHFYRSNSISTMFIVDTYKFEYTQTQTGRWTVPRQRSLGLKVCLSFVLVPSPTSPSFDIQMTTRIPVSHIYLLKTISFHNKYGWCL